MLINDYARFVETAAYTIAWKHGIDPFVASKPFLSEELFNKATREVDTVTSHFVSVGLPLMPDHCAFTFDDGDWRYVIIVGYRGETEDYSLSYFAIHDDIVSLGRYSWGRCFDGAVLNWDDFFHPIDLSSSLFNSLRKGLVVVAEELA